jgi:hypothetical protein
MQAGKLKLVGAALALAAIAVGCSEPTSTNQNAPSIPMANITLASGEFAACKFTVLPGTETLDGATYSSGTVSMTVNGQKLGADSLVEWPTGTQCRVYTLPAGADLTVDVTETPSAGSALYFWRYLINDAAQDPITRLVPGGPTADPFTMTVTGVSSANSYQIYLKNVPFTPPPPGGCTYTIGYWKTHSSKGPAGPADDTWNLVGGPDAAFFLSGTTWYNVFWTSPAGNPYYILAHQYMGAKLNLLDGDTPTPAVTAAIAAAETFFGSTTPAQTLLLTNAQKNALKAYAATLESFNSGATGPGHCGDEVL